MHEATLLRVYTDNKQTRRIETARKNQGIVSSFFFSFPLLSKLQLSKLQLSKLQVAAVAATIRKMFLNHLICTEWFFARVFSVHKQGYSLMLKWLGFFSEVASGK